MPQLRCCVPDQNLLYQQSPPGDASKSALAAPSNTSGAFPGANLLSSFAETVDNTAQRSIQAFLKDTAVQQLLDDGPFSEAFHAPTVVAENNEGDSGALASSVAEGVSDTGCIRGSRHASLSLEEIALRAAFLNKIDVFEACIRQGAQVLTFRDLSGRSALHHAAASGSLDVVRVFLRHVAQQGEVSETCERSTPAVSPWGTNVKKSEKPKDFIVDLNMRDARGWTPLFIAVCRDHTEVAELLLQHQADPHLLLSHNSAPCRETPTHSSVIHFCAMRCNSPLLHILLKHGCSVNERDASNRVPLHYAVARGRRAFIEELLCLGPETALAEDCNKRTPLHVAALRGFPEIAQLLIAFHADLLAKDAWDLTPQDLAHAAGQFNLVPGSVTLEAKKSEPQINGIGSTKTDECQILATSLMLSLTLEEKQLLQKLQHTLRERNVAQLARCVKRLGADHCLEALKKTLRIQSDGGMLTKNGCRKKTSGGVFLSIIQEGIQKGALYPEDWAYITADTKERKRSARAKQRQGLRGKVGAHITESVKEVEKDG